MSKPTRAPYGTWTSPLSASEIASASLRLIDVEVDGDDVYWVEMRPEEQGRCVVVCERPDGSRHDVVPAPFQARTRVHEYGGRSFCVVGGAVYFASFEDQRVYVVPPGGEPRPVTEPGPLRYADFAYDRIHRRILCVREDHGAVGEPEAAIVALDLDDEGSVARQVEIARGHDFFAAPRVRPDGGAIAWLSWEHPCMPWDGTTLWRADVRSDGSLEEPAAVAGGPRESIFQPAWSPEGTLYFVSDRSGWWNLYRYRDGHTECVLPMEAEFGGPMWSLGVRRYGFRSEHEIVCHYDQGGIGHLARILLDRSPAEEVPLKTAFSSFGSICVAPDRAVALAGSPGDAALLCSWSLPEGQETVIRRSLAWRWDRALLSEAEPVVFDGEGGVSHALFYPPRNPGFEPEEGELPPLVVMSHGGPTSASRSSLSLDVQYWTTRGFAVVDVNYGGSSGYGRAYRKRLEGQWGIVDVKDCIAAAQHLAAEGRVDADRLLIRGGSAGGYTTLAALAFHDVFAAGASYYGVSDLEALAKDTHKFESRYLDSLVGPYPERRDLYVARSPIHHVEGLSCPVIFFQGLEDRVVPPDQAERMVEALRAKGVRVAYVPFEGEQHGFRRADNIRRALEEELAFYVAVLGFEAEG